MHKHHEILTKKEFLNVGPNQLTEREQIWEQWKLHQSQCYAEGNNGALQRGAFPCQPGA
jgi:hypothetical protein